jgi:hypothetical protein
MVQGACKGEQRPGEEQQPGDDSAWLVNVIAPCSVAVAAE